MSCPSFTVCLEADPLPLFLQQVKTGSVFWLTVSLMCHLSRAISELVFLGRFFSKEMSHKTKVLAPQQCSA